MKAISTINKPASILIVEDNINLNLMFTRYLKAHGYTITNAYTLRAALDILASLPAPDVLILDLELPDGSSSTIFKLLQHGKFAKTRIVVVSGRPFAPENAFTTAKEIDQVLLKPVAPRGLAALIDTMLLQIA